MRFIKYAMRVKHRDGVIVIRTVAASAAAARHIVVEAERCPASAILSTLKIGAIRK